MLLAIASRDSGGHEGSTTNADKLEMLGLTFQLANYGVGWWCMTTQQKRELAGEPIYDTGSFLTKCEH
jgi:hypothetical protein